MLLQILRVYSFLWLGNIPLKGSAQPRKEGICGWCWGRNLAQRHWQLPFQPFNQSFPVSLQSPLSHCLFTKAQIWCTGPLRGPRFPVVSLFTWKDRSPTDFHSQILHGHLFLALVLWARKPGMVLRPLIPWPGNFFS